MDFIKQIVGRVSGTPSWKDGELSVACIATSNPVYLVFDHSREEPLYVVRQTSSSEINTHHISEKLHRVAGSLVPEPVGLVTNQGHDYSIQKGVPGSPWFQISQHYSTPEQWDRLRNTAYNSLKQFQTRLSTLKEEHRIILPGKELRSAFAEFAKSGTPPPDGLERKVDYYTERLDELGEIEGSPQHGDFSLNNLIFNGDQVTIIDFEDFGITHMPLFDEFTLAASFVTTPPDDLGKDVSVELGLCVQKAAAGGGPFDAEVIKGLFLYHLLLRLGPWSSSQKRQPYRQWLLTLLARFLQHPDECFPLVPAQTERLAHGAKTGLR